MYTDEKIFLENNEIKQAFITLAKTMNPTHKIDIAFNTVRSEKAKSRKSKLTDESKISLNAARRRLCRFDALINQIFLGKYFYRKPPNRRILSICFPENIDSNFHYHGVFRVPDF